MQAVNQCVGRVIRHKGDWAAIILVDERWTASQGGLSPGLLGVGPLTLKHNCTIASMSIMIAAGCSLMALSGAIWCCPCVSSLNALIGSWHVPEGDAEETSHMCHVA